MAYIGKSPSQGVRNRFQYQATAGQQTFSGADANGLTLTYTDSLYMDVYQNGILLVPGDDYTATTGTTVVLVQSASVDDIIEMVVYDVFSVNDSVSASSGGTFSGNVNMGGTLGVTGVPTFTGRSVHSGGITVANDGQIGSVGDADAMAISSSGVVTFSQLPVGAGGITLGTTQASTSGTAIDFTGIPSTAKRISVLFRGVSSNASDVAALVQLGTSSGFVTSGYVSTSNIYGGGSDDATGFIMLGVTTSQTLSGIMTIAHMGSNIYTQAHSGKRSSTYAVFGGGDVSVGGTVTQVRIKQVSGGSFDAGSINVMYE